MIWWEELQMESPGWLIQEAQESTSQGPVTRSSGPSSRPATLSSTSTSVSAAETVGVGTDTPGKLVPPGYAVPSSSSFTYGVPQNVNATSGYHQQSSSTPVMVTNSVTSTVSWPQFPSPSASSGPSFSYSNPNGGFGFSNNQQLQSITPITSSHSEVKNPQSAAATPQILTPAQHIRPALIVPGTALPTPPPVVPSPKGASLSAGSFSFNGNSPLLQNDQSTRTNASVGQPQEHETASSTTSSVDSVLTSGGFAASASVENLAQTVRSTLAGSSLFLPASVSDTSKASGPPGMIGLSRPSSYGPTTPSESMGSSSAAVFRPPVMAQSIPSNQAVHQLVYPWYSPVPPVGVSPQPMWVQPSQMSGQPRPSYLPYPSVYPGPFPLGVQGLPFPSVPLQGSQPPGVAPLSSVIGSVTPMAISSNQVGSAVQKEVLAPGTDGSKVVTEDTSGALKSTNEQIEAWTAHRTETGAVYYYNAVTGESTYEKPPGFKGELGKVSTELTPVSWEKLPGSDWAMVNTNDGKKYYYNSITKGENTLKEKGKQEKGLRKVRGKIDVGVGSCDMKRKISSWQIPTEVTELRKQQESDNLKEYSASVTNSNTLQEKVSSTLSAPALNNGGRESTALRNGGTPGSSSTLDLIKKKLQDPGAPITSSPSSAAAGPTLLDANGSRAVEAAVKGLQSENSKDKLKDTNADGNISDSSSDSEDEDSEPSIEERIIQFKEMLKERGVPPFSKWDKELPKIVFDPRFKAIPSYAERRSLFEHYVRTRADEERREKRAALKAAIDGFKQLLEDAKEDINHHTDYQSFKKKWGSDPRFGALDHKERETLLNERVLPIKKAAEEKAQAERMAAVSNFKSMLQERQDITASTRWSGVKESLRDDPRYQSVKYEAREILFIKYISELKAADAEAEQVAKVDREEQEKLKERERELRKRKEREEQEVERVRAKVRRKEAVASYQALLVETIKDPRASWTESKPKLEKDPQGRAVNIELNDSDLEKLFREHTKLLYERCVHEFKSLLAEVITAEAAAEETEDGKTVLSSWSTAKQRLKSDPRYTKTPRKEREALWQRHVGEIQRAREVPSVQKQEKHSDAKSSSSIGHGRVHLGSRSSRSHR
ncbi:Pre-mRNA-processing protein 40C-like protein [Drosera capensis]